MFHHCFLLMLHLWPVNMDPQLLWNAHTPSHTHAQAQSSTGGVCPCKLQGKHLFPLFRGIYCHRGQSSKFKDQGVTQLHHLGHSTSKYLAAPSMYTALYFVHLSVFISIIFTRDCLDLHVREQPERLILQLTITMCLYCLIFMTV